MVNLFCSYKDSVIILYCSNVSLAYRKSLQQVASLVGRIVTSDYFKIFHMKSVSRKGLEEPTTI